MPAALTYPGVYIEEVPSGVRTITGVATSITAFIGRAKRGPADKAVTINSYADFERIFGGLWVESSLGHAVRDFYLNGGSQAIIVRLYRAEDGKPAKAELDAKGLILQAAYEGAWGDSLRARVDDQVSESVATGFGLTKADLFNLTVRDTKTGVTEQFRNLTIKPSPRQVDKLLKNESRLVWVKDPLPTAVPTAHGPAAAGKDVFEDDNASSKVADDKKASDGQALNKDAFTGAGKEVAKQGLYALEQVDLFNLLCMPPYLASGDHRQFVDR